MIFLYLEQDTSVTSLGKIIILKVQEKGTKRGQDTPGHKIHGRQYTMWASINIIQKTSDEPRKYIM